MGIEDDYAAFCLDQAVRVFGDMLAGKLDEVSTDAKNVEDGKRRRQRVLDQALTPGQTPKQRFADPAAKFS